MILANFALDSYNSGYATFREAQQNAKLSGKLLAHFLETEPTFKDHSITLVGFSLGCQVAKSCINRLCKLNKFNMVHNVYWLAAATFIRDNRTSKQREVLIKTVSGRTSNIICTGDTSLQTFNYVFKEKSLGRSAYFDKCVYNEAVQAKGKKKYKFENFDVSRFVSGHMDYNAKQDLILEFIQFDS